jgi:hypothetical protein
MNETCEPNLFYKIGLIIENCQFLINVFNILSTNNVRLFLNTFSQVWASIFLGPCYEGK